MIRKTANSHNWTRVYCQEIKGKGRVELQSWLTRESSQTREADAANLKAPSMALSWSEAKTPTRPVYHTPSLSLLFLTLAADWAYAQRAILSCAPQPCQYRKAQKAVPLLL